MQRQPHALLDAVMMVFGIHNDNQLADKLTLSTGSVSRIRKGTQNVSASLILTIYERTGLPIDSIKDLLTTEHERRLRRETERQESHHDQ